jgi:hypothetical protein
MIEDLIKLAQHLEEGGHHEEVDLLDLVIEKMAADAKKKAAKKPTKKTKSRTRPEPIFDSKHPKIKDNKDHFPIDTEARARNALARVNQFEKSPPWYDGSLESLVSTVTKAVRKKYKDIEISEAAKKPGKG